MSTHAAALPCETHHIFDIFVGRPQVLSLSPIRVAPGGRYFETFDGEPFLFLGPNDAISWLGLAALYRRRDIAGVEAYLENLANSGVNSLRVMLEYAHRDGRYFERPAGRFNIALVRLWDDLFARCERFGLRILLAPWDNFWMARRWTKHPYCAANGGPAQSPQDFFTGENTIQAIIGRLHFVIERWGGNPAFAAWDLFNEIHPHWGGTPVEQSATIARLSDAVREKELALWGWTRPQTVSIFGPDPACEYEELIFRHPNLDFATTHIYYKGAIDFPKNTVAPALEMARWVRYALERVAPRRPFTDSEHGPIHLFNQHRKTLADDFDDEYERHMMWAHLASGGAGSGMRWPARHPHTTTEGMRHALGNMAAFCRFIDWRHFTPHDANIDITLSHRPSNARASDARGDFSSTASRVITSRAGKTRSRDASKVSGWLVFACRDAHQAVVWLLRGDAKRNAAGCLPPAEAQNGIWMEIRGLLPGDYQVACWDTRAHREAAPIDCIRAQAANDGALRFALPPLKNDLALAIAPIYR